MQSQCTERYLLRHFAILVLMLILYLYGYASAYKNLQQALEKSGLTDPDERAQFTKLLSMSATERTKSVISEDGTVYTLASDMGDGTKYYKNDSGNYSPLWKRKEKPTPSFIRIFS